MTVTLLALVHYLCAWLDVELLHLRGFPIFLGVMLSLVCCT